MATSLLDDKSVENRFRRLCTQWKADTRFLSSTPAIVFHPAYQQIIGLGPAALPLIFAQLENEPDHWFWALHAITGEQPVTAADDGDMMAMAHAWLRWGRQHGYV